MEGLEWWKAKKDGRLMAKSDGRPRAKREARIWFISDGRRILTGMEE